MKFIAVAASILASSLSFSQVQNKDIFDLTCLSADQADKIIDATKQLKSVVKLDDLIAAHRLAVSAAIDLAPAAAECDRQRNESTFAAIQAEFNGCMDTLRKYNRLSRDENLTAARVKSAQEMIYRQIQIERSAYPACR